MVMSMRGRKEYIDTVRLRYLRGSKGEQKKILDELCAITGYHRKAAIRRLNQINIKDAERYKRAPWVKPSRKERRGRKSIYKSDPVFCGVLKALWFATDQMCAVNLKEAIPRWLPHYETEHATLSELVEQKLLKVSAATIGRVLLPSKCRTRRRCGTKPGSMLRTQIPIRTDYWEVDRPGYIESDTVAHCGGSMSGEFAWTVTLTDIDTTWTEIRSVWHKIAISVRDAIDDVINCLPFPVLGFDTDNGAEFINHALVHYFSGKFVSFTRSREYHKNDQAHVEQKNYTHARHILGYDRIDCPQAIPILNNLLRKEVSQLRNHFYPCLKLKEKYRLKSRVKRVYEKPVTPYDRVMASAHVPEEKKEALRAQHEQLNPFVLKRAIEKQLKLIWSLVKDFELKQKAAS